MKGKPAVCAWGKKSRNILGEGDDRRRRAHVVLLMTAQRYTFTDSMNAYSAGFATEALAVRFSMRTEALLPFEICALELWQEGDTGV